MPDSITDRTQDRAMSHSRCWPLAVIGGGLGYASHNVR